MIELLSFMRSLVLVAYVIASIAYLIISIHLCWALLKHKPIAKGTTLSALFIGMLAHSAVLYP
ncbi:hypothetical protein, partial [Pedobacter nototheniae]|uniref:hypothetical protein n=1 Tax=Pedobacter nototheniae TaxID=2488994 RepID=UPI001B8B8862